MIDSRTFLMTAASTMLTGLALGGYAFGAEPMSLRRQSYRVRPPNWPDDFRLRIAALSDIHACRPWMSPDRIRRIVDRTNAVEPDITLLLGDFIGGHRFATDQVPSPQWAAALSGLAAPLGVHAVLGNHDRWDDLTAQAAGQGPIIAHRELEAVGVNVYHNDAVRLGKGDHAFWLAGLGDQSALRPGLRWGRRTFQGVDDLPGTMAKIKDDAPVILMAHEPDIFPKVSRRVALTLSGHTHGGQVRLLGYSPVVPSRYGNRYAYGHVVEYEQTSGDSAAGMEKNLIVSGGLGCSIMPVRFGVPPEIVVVDVG